MGRFFAPGEGPNRASALRGAALSPEQLPVLGALTALGNSSTISTGDADTDDVLSELRTWARSANRVLRSAQLGR